MKAPVHLFPQHFHVHDMSPSGSDVRCEWRTTQERLSKVRVEVQDFRLALLLIDWGTANLGSETCWIFRQHRKNGCPLNRPKGKVWVSLGQKCKRHWDPSAPSKKTSQQNDVTWKDFVVSVPCFRILQVGTVDVIFAIYQGFSAWHGIVSSNRIMVLHDSVVSKACNSTFTDQGTGLLEKPVFYGRPILRLGYFSGKHVCRRCFVWKYFKIFQWFQSCRDTSPINLLFQHQHSDRLGLAAAEVRVHMTRYYQRPP